MLKLITTDSSYFHGEPTINVLTSESSLDGLVKKAADSGIVEFASKITPDPNKIFLHILALGSGQAFGPNKNLDWFPEENLRQYHSTFVSSPAGVYKFHVNKDFNIAMGQVVYSCFNERMSRVELIAWVDRVKGKDLVDRVERGENVATSMACKTPYDFCAVCGNKAHTRQEYCEHLSLELGKLYPNGKRAMAINSGPLNFFDISQVVKPADPTSSVLQKVAFSNLGYDPDNPVIGSAEQAELEGLVEKSANHQKLSEFIKELDGEVAGYDPDLQPVLDKIQDPSKDALPALSEFGLGEVLDTFAHLGISPSLGFLADMIGHRITGDAGIGIGTLVEGYLKEHGLTKLPISDDDYAQAGPNRRIVDVLMPNIKQASIFPKFVEERSLQPMVRDGNTIYVPGTGYGYTGNGPHIEPTPQEMYRHLVEEDLRRQGKSTESEPSFASMVRTLITIGGAALAAKWYITKMIQKRMDEIKAESPDLHTKIALVKSADDAQLSKKLARMSLLKSVGK